MSKTEKEENNYNLGEYLEYEIDIRESIKLIANNERYVF
jgi:hypothetical protein